MAAHWATEAVHVVPVFGERGAWLEHAVFDGFYNYPLSLGIRIRERDALAAEKKARWWAIPLAGLVGAALAAAADYLFVRTAGRAPALGDLWWAVFPMGIAAGYLASKWSWRRKMGKRVVAGIAAGALAGLGYGLFNALLTPLLPGLADAAGAAAANGSAVLKILWKAFVFALLAIPGAFLLETRRP